MFVATRRPKSFPWESQLLEHLGGGSLHLTPQAFDQEVLTDRQRANRRPGLQIAGQRRARRVGGRARLQLDQLVDIDGGVGGALDRPSWGAASSAIIKRSDACRTIDKPRAMTPRRTTSRQ